MATGNISSQKAFIIDAKGAQQTGTIAANTTAWVDLPFNCPQGYIPISISRVYVTGTNVYTYHWGYSRQNSVISIAIRNFGTSATTYTLDATVVCIKGS